MLLVGDPDMQGDIDWLLKWAESGCNVVFADARFFRKNPEVLKLEAGKNAGLRDSVGTIYHHDHICTPHPLLEGLCKAGAIEFDRFGSVYPECIFEGIEKTSRIACAALRIDASFTVPGLSVGEYDPGKGRLVLNNFRIFQCIGEHPFVDMLLINTVKNHTKM